jgi:hypothetical protein
MKSTTLGHPLPQDIYDLIIYHLRHDKNALLACSIVDSNWLRSTRSHLFRRVTLNLEIVHPESIYELLELMPQISPYVRELHFVGYGLRLLRNFSLEPDQLILAHVGLLLPFVNGRVNALCLRRCTFKYDFSDPLARPPNAEILSFLATITTLSIHQVDFMRLRLLHWWIDVFKMLHTLYMDEPNVYGSLGTGLAVGTIILYDGECNITSHRRAG